MKPYTIIGLFLSILFVSLSSCQRRPVETIKGKISNQILRTKDKGYTLKQGIEYEDKIFILDFSAKTHFNKNMKSLPYPEKNGFYLIPEGSEGSSALQIENGETIYFQQDKEYEVIGTLGELTKINFFPSEFESKKHLLLKVKEIKMLESNN